MLDPRLQGRRPCGLASFTVQIMNAPRENEIHMKKMHEIFVHFFIFVPFIVTKFFPSPAYNGSMQKKKEVVA